MLTKMRYFTRAFLLEDVHDVDKMIEWMIIRKKRSIKKTVVKVKVVNHSSRNSAVLRESVESSNLSILMNSRLSRLSSGIQMKSTTSNALQLMNGSFCLRPMTKQYDCGI